jgi:hypothetical protein
MMPDECTRLIDKAEAGRNYREKSRQVISSARYGTGPGSRIETTQFTQLVPAK